MSTWFFGVTALARLLCSAMSRAKEDRWSAEWRAAAPPGAQAARYRVSWEATVANISFCSSFPLSGFTGTCPMLVFALSIVRRRATARDSVSCYCRRPVTCTSKCSVTVDATVDRILWRARRRAIARRHPPQPPVRAGVNARVRHSRARSDAALQTPDSREPRRTQLDAGKRLYALPVSNPGPRYETGSGTSLDSISLSRSVNV